MKPDRKIVEITVIVVVIIIVVAATRGGVWRVVHHITERTAAPRHGCDKIEVGHVPRVVRLWLQCWRRQQVVLRVGFGIRLREEGAGKVVAGFQTSGMAPGVSLESRRSRAP